MIIETIHRGRPKIIVIFTTIDIAFLIESRGECPSLNSTPNCKNDLMLARKSFNKRQNI